MLLIRITNEVVPGFVHLYEKVNLGGVSRKAELYYAFAHHAHGELDFTVARDVSKPTGNRYGEFDECPPNRRGEPYTATVTKHTSTETFALRLTEKDRKTLRGIGPTERSGMLIHTGFDIDGATAACSQGCLVIGGGRAGHECFEAFMKEYFDYPNRNEVMVYVDSRHQDSPLSR